jgi:hypothetical protein
MTDRDQPPVRAGLNPSEGDAGEPFEDPRVLAVVQEYQTELEAGRSPQRAEYIGRYPELSSVISECLDGLELVHRATAASSPSADKRNRWDALSSALLGSETAPSALGDFQIVRELDRGGMGIVYEAVQLSLGRRVALKVLPFAATLDERQLQRFKNEAQAAAQLHHRSIVPIYAFGCERGVHFYAMQLIDGQSLAAVIRDLRKQAGDQPAGQQHSPNLSSQLLADEPAFESPLVTPARKKSAVPAADRSTQALAAVTDGAVPYSEGSFRRIAKLMVQAAEALDHAHQSGVIHRDIKPGNLLVNAAGSLWVADFGLAQFQADTGLTRTGDLLGTIRYMSPEQTTGGRTPLDHRTDIYSLGATFYELLTLQPLFDGESRGELLYEILQSEPRAPRSHNPAIPVELETILLKALNKTSSERYATAGDLAADLQRYLQHQPILARRPTMLDWTRKWARRHPSIVVSGVLLLAIVAVGLTISNWLIAREQQKTFNALEKERTALLSEHLLRDEAEENFQRARHAVDLMIELSENELHDGPGGQSVRQRLLVEALSYYQDFIDQHRGKASLQEDLTKVHEKVKGILHELEVIQRERQLSVLESKSVQKALKLTADQQKRLSALLERWSVEKDSFFKDGHAAPEAERRRRMAQMIEKYEQELAQVLNEPQRLRVKQIVIQSHGIFAFKDQEIILALGLDKQQLAAIREIEQVMFDPGRMGPPRFGMGGDHKEEAREPEENPGKSEHPGPPHEGQGGRMMGFDRKELGAHRRESVARVLAILKPVQLLKWQELAGPPFEGLDDEAFRGPMGFRRFFGPHGPRHVRDPWKSGSKRDEPEPPDLDPEPEQVGGKKS